ncbi:hypothetical protein V2J09_021573 [Rumex salicifolius]
MSCNGCRVLRKGCSDTCVLRPCLQWIPTPESQGHATVFVAKFFGRAGLMSFISNVPDSQRPALFQSLLYEACGRTVNPVSGAVGLLWTGNWRVCQAAVDTVLRGGVLRPVPEFLNGIGHSLPESDEASEVFFPNVSLPAAAKRQKTDSRPVQLDLNLMKPVAAACGNQPEKAMRRETTPSEESGTTISFESGSAGVGLCFGRAAPEPQLLNLFV